MKNCNLTRRSTLTLDHSLALLPQAKLVFKGRLTRRYAAQENNVNWDALGAIAETLGAIAVIATLIYLAVQIRQNSRVTKDASAQSLLTVDSNAHFLFASNGDLASIYRRGTQDPNALDADEMAGSPSSRGPNKLKIALKCVISPDSRQLFRPT